MSSCALREAEGNLTQRIEEDGVTMAAVIGVVQPQYRKYQQPPEAGRG